MVKEAEHIVYYLELTFKEKKMKKFLMGFLLISGLMSQDLPQPAIVGEDLIQPTLKISEFVKVSDKVTVKDERLTFGVRQLLEEAFLNSRYILVEDDNADFVASVEVVYLGRPNEAFSIVGLFNRRNSKTQVNLLVNLENIKTGSIKSSRGEGEIATTITAAGLQIQEDVEFGKTELGGAVRKAIDDAISTLE
tara:strand:+ start:964 stop:1542 length:579 start_codon:yes stop_codon:yes gene_type:complete